MTNRPKLRHLALVLLAGGVSACETAMAPFGARGSTATFMAITTEEEFRAEVVGREVEYANGSVGAYGEDGTWTVTDGDAVLGGGTWQWQGERWCREGSTVDGPVEPGCDAVAVSGAGVRFTREDGSQGVLPFRT